MLLERLLKFHLQALVDFLHYFPVPPPHLHSYSDLQSDQVEAFLEEAVAAFDLKDLAHSQVVRLTLVQVESLPLRAEHFAAVA